MAMTFRTAVAGGRGNGCDGWCPVVVAMRAARKLGDAWRAAPSEALTKERLTDWIDDLEASQTHVHTLLLT